MKKTTSILTELSGSRNRYPLNINIVSDNKGTHSAGPGSYGFSNSSEIDRFMVD